MIRFRLREFIALTVLLSVVLILNYSHGNDYSTPSAVKSTTFRHVHHAAEQDNDDSDQYRNQVIKGPIPPRPHFQDTPSRPEQGPAGHEARPPRPQFQDDPSRPEPAAGGHDSRPPRPQFQDDPSRPESAAGGHAESDNVVKLGHADERPASSGSEATSAMKDKQAVAVPIATVDDEREQTIGFDKFDSTGPHDADRFPISSTINLPLGTPHPMPSIQFAFDEHEESKEIKAARNEKLQAIRDAAMFTWKGYKKHAWMHDEVKPVSGGYRDPFGHWAATLIDSLDTLYIMGLDAEFKEAVAAVEDIDFVSYSAETMPLFEVTIRYLGGLLGAYDISGGKHPILLAKAAELADYLLPAFDTPNRMPIPKWKHRSKTQTRSSDKTNLAEIGSLSLEFTRLAQITKEFKYYDVVARITLALADQQEESSLPGLWSVDIDASGCKRNGLTEDSAKMLKTTDDHDDKKTGKSKAKITYDDDVDEDMNEQDTLESTRKNELDDLMSTIERKAKEAVLKADREGEPQDKSAARPKAAEQDSLKRRIKRQLDFEAADDKPARSKGSDHKSANMNDDGCEPQSPLRSAANSRNMTVFSIGSRADSAYEYLPKQYILLGGLEDSYKSMYTRAADTATKNLLFRPMTPDNDDILVAGKLGINGTSEEREFIAESTHLTCFAGAMYAYGAKLFDRPTDLVVGRQLTDGCVWAYDRMPSGIMPEHMILSKCEDASNCKWSEAKMKADTKIYEESAARTATSPDYGPAIKAPPIQAKNPAEDKGSDGRVHALTDESSGPADVEDEVPHAVTSSDVAVPTTKVKATFELDEQSVPKRSKGGTKAVMHHDPEDSDMVKRDLSDDTDYATRSVDSSMGETAEDGIGPAHGGIAKLPPGKMLADELEADDEDEGSSAEDLRQDTDNDGVEARREVYASSEGEREASIMNTERIKVKESDSSKKEGSADKNSETLPKGVLSIASHEYKLRPEAIESVFYLYRVTGDSHWREVGWRMWTAIEKATLADYGYSAVRNVNSEEIMHADSTESFWMAETLKYFYLLFADETVVSLDEWVLNTEAHPFKRPDVTKAK